MGGVGKDSTGVLVLAATNIPWALDTAILRRFQVKVHIGLPDTAARVELFKLSIRQTGENLSSEDYQALARESEEFSGSDIANAVEQANLKPIRLVMHATHFRPVSSSPSTASCVGPFSWGMARNTRNKMCPVLTHCPQRSWSTASEN